MNTAAKKLAKLIAQNLHNIAKEGDARFDIDGKEWDVVPGNKIGSLEAMTLDNYPDKTTKIKLQVMVLTEEEVEQIKLHRKSDWVDPNRYGPRLDESHKNPAAWVNCKICRELCVASRAHRHDDGYIGDECCWDPRLHATE